VHMPAMGLALCWCSSSELHKIARILHKIARTFDCACTAGLLMPEEIAWLMAQRHKPLGVGQALSTILQAVDVDSIVKTRLDRLISTYVYEFGGCNRIYNTAIPSAYTR